jgi:hypothetical protein
MSNAVNFRIRVVLALCALMLSASNSFSKDKPKEDVVTVHGIIMDSQCAFNVHSEGRSHDLMTKGGIHGSTDEETCTQHCVREMGGSYVLLAKKEVYRLEDQIKPEPFAGKKVKITGPLKASTNTIHDFTIEIDK